MVKLRSQALSATLALGCSFAALSTMGEREARAEWTPVSMRAAIGGDIYTWPARDLFVATLVPFFKLDVAPRIFLDIDLPFTFTNFDGGRNDAGGLALGNPALAVRYANTVADGHLTFTIGGGGAVPVANLNNDDFDWNLSLVGAAASMGLWDAHLWSLYTFPLFGRFGLEWQPSEPIMFRFFADPIFFVPFGRRDDPELLLQSKIELEFRHDRSGLGGGAGLRFVGSLTDDARDGRDNLYFSDVDIQTTANPFFSYDPDKTFFMRAGFLVGLNQPLGFGFDRNKLFALHLLLGGRLN